ncbi:VOC family protein [Dyella sp. KRB-257]|uniref:VOC family protein n=1 Tax=Dyella sp. KRB-257 TaxID=3400915 RepID=UPI003C0BA119
MSFAPLLNLPGVTAEPEAATRGYVFNHTMIRMKHIAFIKDPDGYWIEILQPTSLAV